MNRVFLENDAPRAAQLARDTHRALLRSLRSLRLRNCDLSLLLTTDRKIARLNRSFRKINKPTDVLSFPSGERARAGSRCYLGDIAISVPTAKKQARKAKHPAKRECAMLAVHGLLHLLGHDHAEAGEARRMFSLQTRILFGVNRA